MALEKKGSPTKGVKIVSEQDFNLMYKMVEDDNNLIRCPKCGRLVSKLSSDKENSIQHKGLKAIIKNAEKIYIKCVDCGTTIEL